MKGLIQRTRAASVTVDGEEVGRIERGLVLFLGAEMGDGPENVRALIHKVLNYRVFCDEQGRMNQSLLDVDGQLLLVSQFTLAANTQKGLRPSFSGALGFEPARALYELAIDEASRSVSTQSGRFGADMQVQLINDGPVTFWLDA